jgi:hypothetical protein
LSFVVATFSSESSLENRAIIAGGQILPEWSLYAIGSNTLR